MKSNFHSGGCSDFCCLDVKDLSVQIGEDLIFSGVNLHVHCGQMVALIGPNGAGKSTLLKALLGERPYNGTISFQVPHAPKSRPKIGYVPQSPNFDPGDPVSVADLFACCLSSRPAFLGLRPALRSKVLKCLSQVHGEELIDKRVGTLSGGELQRVLLALALEPIPNILILDEPLSGVDIEGMTNLMDMLDEIRQKFDLSILMTTHDFSMLPKYADTVVLIDHQVKIQGSPELVLHSPEFQQAFHMKGVS